MYVPLDLPTTICFCETSLMDFLLSSRSASHINCLIPLFSFFFSAPLLSICWMSRDGSPAWRSRGDNSPQSAGRDYATGLAYTRGHTVDGLFLDLSPASVSNS